jgi:hypothetical protein
VPQFSLLDAYSRRARLVPAMLTTLPAVLAAASWLPALTLGPFIAILFSWFGVGILLAELGRDLGKRRESGLWESWGGSPTVRRLRLRDPTENVVARDRWRASIARIASETPLLTEHEEAADPRRADQTIGVCVARLRELTRDASQFPLIFQENVSYGFRRNLWGMKPAAVALAILAIAAVMSGIAFGHVTELHLSVMSVGCSVVMLTWWALRIRPSWVREAAERYADQLLWSCEQLNMPNERSRD